MVTLPALLKTFLVLNLSCQIVLTLDGSHPKCDVVLSQLHNLRFLCCLVMLYGSMFMGCKIKILGNEARKA